MLRGLYRSRCEQIGGIASAVRGLALDEVVDLILLAHEDEFVVAMHDQFLGAVLELLAWGLEAHHGHAVLVMYLYVLDAAAYRVQGRVDLDDGVRPVDFDVIQIIAGHQMAHALARHRSPR